MIAYKFLAASGRALFSGRDWPLPSAAPGVSVEWVEATGPLAACRNGVHACEPLDLPYWIGEVLWEVELDGEQIRGPQSIVAQRGRLTRRVDAWNPTNARSFAAQCRARAEAFVAKLPKDADPLDEAGQYLDTVRSTFDSGNYTVVAFASAMAFTLGAPSASAAFAAERGEQGALLQRLLGL